MSFDNLALHVPVIPMLVEADALCSMQEYEFLGVQPSRTTAAWQVTINEFRCHYPRSMFDALMAITTGL